MFAKLKIFGKIPCPARSMGYDSRKIKTETETHPQNRRLGYARVSTYGQTLDAQLEQLPWRGLYEDFPREGDWRAHDRRQLLKMLDTIAELSPNLGDGLRVQAAAVWV